MKKLLLVSLCFLLFCVTQIFAQNRTITGTVVAKEDGLPMPGVTVRVKGSTAGTQTNTAGKFTLSVPTSAATLVFSFIGYESLEVPIRGDVVNASLNVSSKQLGEVVITGALGIKKQEKEVGYATTRITGANADETNVINPINGLTGKVAGLTVQQTDEGVDPTVRINLRGNRSLLGNNNALIVVDGVPVPSNTLATINPADIEDYNVLNGSGAAALYGSEASNGAIVITTKRGTADGKPVIKYTNSLQLQQVANFPKFQQSYGQYGGEGDGGLGIYINPITGFANYVPFENQQYGPEFNGQTVQLGLPANSPTGPVQYVKYSALPEDPIKSFFQTGVTEQNDISFSQGDAKNSIFISAQNVNVTGVVPEDASERTTGRLSLTKTYGIFHIDGTASYTKTTISTYGTGWDGSSLYTTLVQLPDDVNIKNFKDANNGLFANPSNYFSAYSINPYWTVENSRINTTRENFQGNLNMVLSPTKWLDASYRISDNAGTYESQYNRTAVSFTPYAISPPEGAYGGTNIQTNFPNGILGYTQNEIGFGDGTSTAINTTGPIPNYFGGQGYSRLQGDAVLNFHHTFFNDWKAGLILGNTIWEEKANYTVDNSGNLLVPDIYNIHYIGGNATLYSSSAIVRQIAYFGDLSISYKSWANLEATLRNDQDSRLDPAHNSFYYPSVKASFIPTDAFPQLKNNVLNYLKVYGDVSQVGQVSLGPYEINNTYNLTSGFPFGSLGGLNLGSTNYPPGLKPETISEYEFGGEVGLFNDRVDLKGGYYHQASRNQTLNITTSPSTGYSNTLINAGEIDSWGEEFSAIINIFQRGASKVGWSVGGNLSINNSKVVSLYNGVTQLDLGNEYNINGQNVGGEYAIVGKSFPQLLTTDYQRDPQGRVVVNANDGIPNSNPNLVDQGRATPKYNLGLNTSVSYDIVTLNIVAEYRTGNVVYNGLGSYMDFGGTSFVSAEAGRQIFIYPNSVLNTGTSANPVYTPNTTVPVYKGGWEFWSTYPPAVGSPYVTSAAFWKIREISLDFKLDKYVKKTGFIKGASFALTGRNLFTFLPKSEQWGDPELSDAAATSNNIGASSVNQLPSSRIYGGRLSLTF